MRTVFTSLRLIVALVWTVFIAAPVLAQNAMVEQFLEDTLSVAGQTVTVDELSGVLSGDIRVEKITVSDAQGPWLVLSQGRLDWDRGAILGGVLNIRELSANELHILRRPVVDGPAPSHKSGPFEFPALPELPIEAALENFKIDTLRIDKGYQGQDLFSTANGMLTYGQGRLLTKLDMVTRNARGEKISLNADYGTQERVLTLNMSYSEGTGGILGKSAGFTHNGPLSLNLDGSGPADRFAAKFGLTTGQTQRMGGDVVVTSDAQGTHVVGSLNGDLSPIIDTPVAALKRAGNVSITLDATQHPDGRVTIQALDLSSETLSVNGLVHLTPQGWPEKIDLSAELAAGVLAQDLATAGVDNAQFGQGNLNLAYDRALGDGWALDAQFQNATLGGISTDLLRAKGSGVLQDRMIRGTLDAVLDKVGAPENLADILNGTVSAQTKFAFAKETGFEISQLNIQTAAVDLQATLDMSPEFDQLGLTLSGDVAQLASLRKLSGLANLSGSASGSAQGNVALKTGAFDVTADLRTDALTGAAKGFDDLTKPPSTLTIALRRDETGTILDQFFLSNREIRAALAGALLDENSMLQGNVKLSDAARLDKGLSGPVTANLTATQANSDAPWRASGTMTAVQNTKMTFSAMLDNGAIRDLTTQGQANLALLNGLIAPHTIKGVTNFDINLPSISDLGTLSGNASVSSGTIAIQGTPAPLEQVNLTANITQGRAAINTTAAMGPQKTKINGSGNLSLLGNMPIDVAITSAPMALPLTAGLDTRVSSNMRLNGDLLGALKMSGRIDVLDLIMDLGQMSVGQTSTLNVTHTNANASTINRLKTLGLIADSKSDQRSKAPIALDIIINAPNRLFARGRGVDAEFGGSMRLGGTAENPVPTGQFDLIRGRIDVLTKRVRLDQGRLLLLGTLDPEIYLKADVDAQEGDVLTVEITGRSSQPELILSSLSGRPSEEVLAEVLFGKALDGLSTWQTIQLVNAIRTLGSPNPSLMERMRRVSGLDDFDITQTEEGDVSISAGKYIRENAYLEVEFGSNGTAETRLNLDLNSRTKGFITHDTKGESQIGITFGKDYD